MSYKGFEKPEQEFIELYLSLCYEEAKKDEEKMQKLESLWEYVKKNTELEEEYCILIESRN